MFLHNDLKEKKILFFAPAFFGYEEVIAKKMRDLGAFVDLYDERSVNSSIARAFLKISPCFFIRKTKLYYEKIIQRNIKKNYDYVFIIKCDMISRQILIKLKQAFPNAKFCLYLYDAIRNIPNIKGKFKYFDTIHSFDLDDCNENPELFFRPLFFSDDFRKKFNHDEHNYKYDISFLGTIHSDRYATIKQVQKIANNLNLSCYWFLYLQSKFIYWFYKITKKEFRYAPITVFSFSKMPASDIAKIVCKSKTILDIQHPKQTGLTMRTIEMIGMNKKLITTNASIAKYDFFDKRNIAIIDRKNVDIPRDFLNSSYIPLQSDVYEKYSLKSWILDVLN